MAKFLNDGLDELARNAHAGFFQRIAMTCLTASVAAMMIPWRLCMGWAAGARNDLLAGDAVPVSE